MDQLKKWVALAVVGALAIVAAGWFLLVSPKRAEATALREQAASQVSANQQLETQLQVLRAQAKDLPKKQAELAKVAAKIPGNPALPALIRALSAASASAGVEFVSVTPGAPGPLVATAAVAPVAPAAPGAPPAAAPPAVPVAPAAGAPAPPAPAAVAPVPGAAGGPAGTLAEIPVAINVVGDYYEIEQFLANLENLPRALRVTKLALAPGTGPTAVADTDAVQDGSSLSSTVTGSVFMAASAAPVTPVVAPPVAPAAVVPAPVASAK